MLDREKVIRAMECCAVGAECDHCPYTLMNKSGHEGCYQMHTDALALLKAQEPRVLTLEEVQQHNNQDGCVWFEQPTYNADAAFVIQDEDYTEIISPYILGEPINHGYWSNSNYGKTWRCWTSRPTDEQREAVKWDE